MNNDLAKIIKELINKKREGEYWDFKREYYRNNADLLHDIICMANSLHDGNRYIIIGVENSEFEIIGIKGNTKSQANIIDFLANMSFLGGIRPEVELHSLKLNGKKVDVIVIFDKPEKPYCLSKDYKKDEKVVKANNIYTRIGDTNTSKGKSADLYHVEKMWRQKFGIDLPIIDRFKKFLQSPQEWADSSANQYGLEEHSLTNRCKFPVYHKYFPEFQVELSEPEQREGEGFCYFYPNPESYWGQVFFKYHNTIIFQMGYVCIDGGRILLPIPDTKNLFPDEYGCYFYYYILSNDHGLFLKFLHNETTNINDRCNYPSILLFKDQIEFEAFVAYAKKNEKKIDSLEHNAIPFRGTKGEGYEENIIFLIRINQLYSEWKLGKTD